MLRKIQHFPDEISDTKKMDFERFLSLSTIILCALYNTKALNTTLNSIFVYVSIG